MNTALSVASQDAYERECAARHVHPNSALKRSIFVGGGRVQVLDLSHNLVGPRGLGALQPLLSDFASTLHTLILAHNNLDNRAVTGLAKCLASGFPALRVVDLSGNTFTYQAAKQLARMCEGVTGAGLPPSAGLPTTAGANTTNADTTTTSTAATYSTALPSTHSSSAETTPAAARLTPAQLFENGLSYVGHDNNIDQVVLESMPLLSSCQCDCILRRIDAAIARRQERKRKLKAFQRDVRRRSTVAALSTELNAHAAAATGDVSVAPTPVNGVEEDYPDDVARTPRGRETSGADPEHSQFAASPNAFLEQAAAGELQVDIGMPKAPQIPEVLLHRRLTPAKTSGALTPLHPSPRGGSAHEAQKDSDTTPLQALRPVGSQETSLLGTTHTSHSPLRPPRPNPSTRAGAPSHATDSFLAAMTEQAEGGGEDMLVAAAIGDALTDAHEDELFGDEGGFEEEELLDEEGVAAHMYPTETGQGVDDGNGNGGVDDWLFTGALEPVEFTPPGSGPSPPHGTHTPGLPAADPVEYDAYAYALQGPSAQSHLPPATSGASGGFFDDLQFDLGAMDDPTGEGPGAAPAWMTSGVEAAPATETVLFGDAQDTTKQDAAPSWLEF